MRDWSRKLTRRLLSGVLLILAACASDERPSILLVTIDTLRADHVGCYGAPGDPTPSLDRLAREGTLFELAVTTAPITLPAHVSMMTGLYPPGHGVRNNGHVLPPDGAVTLAQRLASEGYQTAAFVSAYVLSEPFGLSRGFEHFDDDFGTGLERRADATVKAAEEWLTKKRDGDRPAFVWVHLFDPHDPYQPPPEYVIGDASPYAGEIRYADAAVGRIRERFSSVESKRTPPIFVATSDHGEGLGEHGEDTHSFFLYDTTVRVPLILAGPGIPVGRRIERLTSLVDLTPTLLELVGAELPPRLGGWSLLRPEGSPSTGRDRLAYLETMAPRLVMGWSEIRGAHTGSLKLIDAPQAELYDLQLDPREQENQAVPRREHLPDLRREMERVGGPDRVALDTEAAGAARKLRQLGYLNTGSIRSARGGDPKDFTTLIGTFFRVEATIASGDVSAMKRLAAKLREQGALDPENPVVFHSLGRLWLRAGELEAAIEALEHSLRLDEELVLSRLDLASALAQDGQLDRAEAELEKVLSREPDNPEAWHDLGSVARSRESWDRASECYEKAALLSPDDPTFHLHALQVALRLGQRELADRHATTLERLLPVDDDHLDRARVALARHDRSLGRLAEARARLEVVLARRPDHPGARREWQALLQAEQEQGR